jgi:hypothetical protein
MIETAASFPEAFRGRFVSLLQWADLDTFWQVVRRDAAAGWYLYALGENPPSQPAAAPQITQFIDEIDALLRRDHRETYCAIVYTDSKTKPRFIKIYDPQRLGAGCGASGDPPLPGWILCRTPPTTLTPGWPIAENRRRWWRQLWNPA